MSKNKNRRKRGITWKTLPERINKVREKILSAGNTIGSVTFEKRSDSSIRRMSYRLHAKNPSFAKSPSCDAKTRSKDFKNLQLTVLDVNKVIRDSDGTILGRGAYRTIPLENVKSISVRGILYSVNESKRNSRNIDIRSKEAKRGGKFSIGISKANNVVGPEFACLPY